MKKAFGTIIATFGLLTVLAFASGATSAQTSERQASAAPATAGMAASPKLQTAQVQATADKAKAKIGSSSSERKALLGAVQTKSEDQAKSVLLRNGFTAKQLEGAKIVLNDKTGGKGTAETIIIRIDADCCPLRITITISF